MKKIKSALLFVISLPVIIWILFTRQAYYVTGTFIDKDGERMFFKTTFVTHYYIFPIKSIEDRMHKEFGGERPIILFFYKIPYRMLKYIEADYDEKIEIKKTPNH